MNFLESLAAILQPELEKEAAVKKEKRRPWNVANVRSGRRPMRVETMLKKEKDGTLRSKYAEAVEKCGSSVTKALQRGHIHPNLVEPVRKASNDSLARLLSRPEGSEALERLKDFAKTESHLRSVKSAQFYGPIIPFSDVTDKGAAPRGKKNPDNIPSAEDVGALAPKREDGRANLVTEMAPGTHLNEVAATNQPQERTASVRYTVADAMLDKVAGLREYLLSDAAEKHTDLGGLGLMAASSLDKLRSQLKHPEDPEKSLVGGTAGRSGMDLTGLAAMATPTVARLVSGTGDKLTNVANLAGLGALAVPTLDNVQAGIRARRAGVDPEKKMLLGHKAHAGLELAGLGTLAAPVVRGGLSPHSAMTLAGYGTLAAPVVEDLVQHDEKKKLFQGAGRSATELAGLGLLAGGALGHGHG